MRVEGEPAREYYIREAAEPNWSTRRLESRAHYELMLRS